MAKSSRRSSIVPMIRMRHDVARLSGAGWLVCSVVVQRCERKSTGAAKPQKRQSYRRHCRIVNSLRGPLAKDQRMTLTKKQRRIINRVTQGDAQFFKLNPNRSYRVRLADPAEIVEIQLREKRTPVPAEWCVYVAICKVAPRVRLRAFLLGRRNDYEDIDEEEAAALFG